MSTHTAKRGFLALFQKRSDLTPTSTCKIAGLYRQLVFAVLHPGSGTSPCPAAAMGEI